MKSELVGTIYYEDGFMHYPNAYGTHDSFSYIGFNIIPKVRSQYGYNSNEYKSLEAFVYGFRELREKFSGIPDTLYWDQDEGKWNIYNDSTSIEVFIKSCRLQQKRVVV